MEETVYTEKTTDLSPVTDKLYPCRMSLTQIIIHFFASSAPRRGLESKSQLTWLHW
jgi:hypothetical protein